MAKRIDNGNFPVNVNFNLRATKPANKDMAVNAIVRFNNQRIVISGITKAQPRYWKDGEPTQHVGNANAKEIKKCIRKAEAIIIDTFTKYTDEHNSFPGDLKAFQELLRKRVFNIPDEVKAAPVEDKSVRNYTDRFMAEIKGGIRLNANKKPYAKDSHKAYGNLSFHLEAYAKSRGMRDVCFDDVTLDFYEDFRDYIASCDLSPGYFGALIKCLKTVMANSMDEGYHNNATFKHKKFVKVPAFSETAIYLDEAKLDALYALDLSMTPYLDRARDLFLIGAYTGLRFSDFSSIRPEYVQGDYIRIKTQKTGERVTIPISTNLRAILDKYNGATPPAVSNQKLNDYLKEVGKVAGFSDEVDEVEYKQGKKIIKQVPFYSLMTTHTARRSFATNMFAAGIPTLLIMAITGHRTEKAFLTYIRQNNDDKAKMFKTMLDRMEAEKARTKLKVVGGGE